MSSLLKVDRRTKYSVYGWIRNMEILLKDTTIPPEIIEICILYCRDEEVFNVISDVGIEISENKKIITKVGKDKYNDNNNYGIIEIESESACICQWDLRAIKISDGLAIGIASKQVPNEQIKDSEDCCYYLFYQEDDCSWTSFHSDSTDYGHGDQKKWAEGDKISISVDFQKCRIQLLINDVDAKRAVESIQTSQQTKYQLFVSLHSIGDSIEILNFTRN